MIKRNSINYVNKMFDLICGSGFMTTIISRLERFHGVKLNVGEILP